MNKKGRPRRGDILAESIVRCVCLVQNALHPNESTKNCNLQPKFANYRGSQHISLFLIVVESLRVCQCFYLKTKIKHAVRLSSIRWCMKFLTLGFAFQLICFVSVSQQRLVTEVLVVGGGTGGTAAAIQCSRMGVATILVEETAWLGGMLTAAGVSCTDGNDELPSGMWQDFREALYSHYKTRNLGTGWVSNTCFEPHVGDSIFKAWAVREKKLTVLHGWYFDHVQKKGNKTVGAIFKNARGQFLTVEAKITIDATDLGDVFSNAGAVYDLGMEDKFYADEEMAPGKINLVQDLTWVAILKDFGATADKTIQRPTNYDSTRYFCSCTEAPCPFGNPKNVGAKQLLEYGRLPHDKFMLNWPAHGNDFYANVVDISPLLRNEILINAKQKTLGFVYFIQTQLGFKNIGFSDEFGTIDKLALMPYHREGRRLKGVVRLNVNHLAQPFDQKLMLYRTGIAVGDYPLDHHHGEVKEAPEIKFPNIPSFNVPLGALIPETIDGLIVCDKGISVSNLANGSTRLQPCVLLTGQAAGVLAALSIEGKVHPRNMNVKKVQAILLKEKCYLMPYVDVNPDNADWQAVQRVGSLGLVRGVGKPQGWANKTYFYPDSTITVAEFTKCLSQWNFVPTKLTGTGSTKTLTRGIALELITDFVVTSEFCNLKSKALQKFIHEFDARYKWNDQDKPIKRIELTSMLDFVLTRAFLFDVTLKGEVVQKIN
jgi:hypothetical protein